MAVNYKMEFRVDIGQALIADRSFSTMKFL